MSEPMPANDKLHDLEMRIQRLEEQRESQPQPQKPKVTFKGVPIEYVDEMEQPCEVKENELAKTLDEIIDRYRHSLAIRYASLTYKRNPDPKDMHWAANIESSFGWGIYGRASTPLGAIQAMHMKINKHFEKIGQDQ